MKKRFNSEGILFIIKKMLKTPTRVVTIKAIRYDTIPRVPVLNSKLVDVCKPSFFAQVL